jgi:hypothetical protein
MNLWFVACEEESFFNNGNWSPSVIASYPTRAESEAFVQGVGYGSSEYSGDIDTFILSKYMTDAEIEQLVVVEKDMDDPKRRGNLIERLIALRDDPKSYTK